MVAIPPKPPTKTSHTTPTNRRRHAEHNQHSHLKSTRPWPFQATTGGFATIDPRHADDTPQSSAYGSNSPQATNKDDPSHNDTRDIPPDTTPPDTTANPSHHTGTQPRNRATTGGFATIDPRHADDTPQSSAYGSNSPHRAQASTKAPPSQPSTRRNVGTESRHKPQPHQSQHQASPKHPQASPKAAHKICPSDPKHPQATPTHPTHPTHTKRRRGLSRGAPTRLTAGDTCYLMRVQTTT